MTQRVLAKEMITSKVNKKAENLDKFYKWFVERAKKGIVSKVSCAEFIAALNPKRDITLGFVSGYILEIKRQIEARMKTTIHNTRGEGWSIATPKQTAVTLIRTAKKTVRYADRTVVLYGLTDKKLIPGAVHEVFGKEPKEKALLEEYNERFIKLFKTHGAGGLLE